MRNSVKRLASAGFGHTLPSFTLEFFGSVSSTMMPALSINPLLRLDVLHFVRQRVGMHRPVIELRLAGLVIEPRQRVLHPILVVAFGKVLARMRAARFLSVQ